MRRKKEKKKFNFPTAFTICFIVVAIATVLTWIVPAGGYDTIEYNSDTNNFTVTSIKDGSKTDYPATQGTLDKFHINTQLNSFTSGKINKPMSIMGTYSRIEQKPQGIYDFLKGPIEGISAAIEIIIFCFMIGGTIGILNYMGAFNAGIVALAEKTKGQEKFIIVIIILLVAAGGTIFGFQEETIAFYPIFIPILLATGFDGMTAVVSIFAASVTGCMFATINPFAVVIGSYAAGITFTEGIIPRLLGLILCVVCLIIFVLKYAMKVKKDPSKSLTLESDELSRNKYSADSMEDIPEFTLKMKLALVVFALAFVLMVIGIIAFEWSFTEMSVIFLVCGVLIGIIGGIGEKNIVSQFINGAAELVGVVLIIGVARAVSIILDTGRISGTILNSMANAVSGLPPVIFIILVMLLFVVLGIFISSTSGVALLALPIMAPLADVVGVPREVVISAYLYGLGLIGFISPTGMVLPSLEMAHVSYGKWIRFILPFMGIAAGIAIVMLLLEYYVFC